MKPKPLRRIFLKENRANSFRFRSTASELSARPLGKPQLLVISSKTNSIQNQASMLAPDDADAYLLGSRRKAEAEYDEWGHYVGEIQIIALQYYKIQVVH